MSLTSEIEICDTFTYSLYYTHTFEAYHNGGGYLPSKDEKFHHGDRYQQSSHQSLYV